MLKNIKCQLMTRLHAVPGPHDTELPTWAREANAPLDFADIGQSTNIFVPILTIFCQNTVTNIFKHWTFCTHGCFLVSHRAKFQQLKNLSLFTKFHADAYDPKLG